MFASRLSSPPAGLALPPLTSSFHLPTPIADACPRLHRSGRRRSPGICTATRRFDWYGAPKKGFWEDPDDGMGSETDEEEEGREEEEEEEEENDLDFESDWETGGEVGGTTSSVRSIVDRSSRVNEEEKLAEEVDRLLEPEERAILQGNAAPKLDKISTAKWSALHTLTLAGQIPYMDMLLENGLDIETTDKDGRTALHTAIMGKKEAVTSHLLRKGASPHARDRGGATPLHYAVQAGAKQTVKLLIKCNADVNIADNEGWTPLHVAIQSRNKDIAKILLVNGADKTRRNTDGRTPLDISLCFGKDFKSFDLARLLKVVSSDRYY